MSYTNRARDLSVAAEVIEDRELMCPAKDCPYHWSVQGDRGRACSAHYWADRKDWPHITEKLLRDRVSRALARSNEKETST